MSEDEKIKQLALSMIGKIDSIKKVREFMFGDLEKTIDLVNTPKGAPNFLVALVLCCYTEYWGRFILGISERHGKECFEAFFKKLGSCYVRLLDENHNIYGDVRCGLAHAYLIEGNAAIYIEGGDCGIEHEASSNRYNFRVRRYYEDFKRAVDRYIADLEEGKESMTCFELALKGKPTLV